VQIHTVHPDPSDAERHAKAEATRLALANIAAAAHAAHLHDDEVAAAKQAAGEQPAAPAAEKRDADARPAAVLTFGGEKVVLPFVEHAEEQQPRPALTLDRLAEAFAHLGQPATEPETAPDAEGQQAQPEPEQAHQAEPAAPVQQTTAAPQRAAAPEKDYSDHTLEQTRQRRPRRHRSASRAQGAANETAVQQHEDVAAASAGHSHEAKAPEQAGTGSTGAEQPAAKAAEAPIILGVGVPASEL
jgi:ribonuclease E